MSRLLSLMLIVSTCALASGSSASSTETDIVQRTVNFLIFVGVVWYLVAEPVKNFFASRSQSIADELKKVQEKLNESITLKKEAEIKANEAQKYAEELKMNAKKENKIINDNIMSQCEAELEVLHKQHLTLMDFEQRKMVRQVVEEVLGEVLAQSGDSFDREAMANVILKKVA